MKRNKALLIWNIVITTALFLTVISGCAALDPQYAATSQKVDENRALIEQVIALATSNREAINTNNTAIIKNTLTLSSVQTTTQAAIAASDAALRQLIQTYMAAQQ
ncbi:MAG: hypothetical protein HQ577_07415 [Dehalococcoidia bacterium]|nr:hypothetical protein [Dehalococcoidia bacterium]